MRPSKKIIIPLIVALVILGAGATVWALHSHRQQANNRLPGVDYTPAKASDNAQSEARKNNPPTSTDNKGSQQTLTQTGTNPSAHVTITGANVDQGSQTLYVGSLVVGTTSGSCTLTLSQSGNSTTVTRTNSVVLQNNSYICPTFSVPTGQLGPGTWNVKLEVTTNGSTISDTKTVQI